MLDGHACNFYIRLSRVYKFIDIFVNGKTLILKNPYYLLSWIIGSFLDQKLLQYVFSLYRAKFFQLHQKSIFAKMTKYIFHILRIFGFELEMQCM